MAGSAETASTLGAFPAGRRKLYWEEFPSLTDLPPTFRLLSERSGITFRAKESLTVVPSMVTAQVMVATPMETAFRLPSAATETTEGLLLVHTALAWDAS